jgi:uncharacterized protein YecE (DUF72 family)
MLLHVGTSGFSYAEWKGKFYPTGTKEAAFLGYYASKFDTVEINNTFYRMPKPELLTGWAGKVPPEFVFVLKASQRITHHAKLENTEDNVGYFWNTAQLLGGRLGPVLFQLPPYLRKDSEKLKRFLGSLPKDMRAVMEFRHRSWFAPETLEETLGPLRDHGATLVFSDVDPSDEDDPGLEQPFEATTDYGYVRLRRGFYEDEQLREWTERIKAHAWKEVFVFFKHETTGPELALKLKSMWG